MSLPSGTEEERRDKESPAKQKSNLQLAFKSFQFHATSSQHRETSHQELEIGRRKVIKPNYIAQFDGNHAAFFKYARLLQRRLSGILAITFANDLNYPYWRVWKRTFLPTILII